MTLVVEQRSPVSVLTRQAAILIRGVRPSYGWLAGVSPPGAEVFDEARLLGWQVGCRMLSRRLAVDEASDPLLTHLTDWVRFELHAEATRWRRIRPVATLGAHVFEDLVDRDETEPAMLRSWAATLEWCLARCDAGDMEVGLDDRYLLDSWRDRAGGVRGGQDVAALLRSLGRHAVRSGCPTPPAPLLRKADVSLVRTLLEHESA